MAAIKPTFSILYSLSHNFNTKIDVLGWGRVGLGLDMGWTIKLINVLNVSIISPIGLDYGKNTRIFSEKFVQANQLSPNVRQSQPLRA